MRNTPVPQAHRTEHGFSGQGILAHGRNHYQGGSRRHVDLDRAGAGARGELVECRGGGGVSWVEGRVTNVGGVAADPVIIGEAQPLNGQGRGVRKM